MKATGIVRRIDDLGRIVIPKSLRHTLNIAEGDPLEVFVDGDTVVLKKYYNSCGVCGKTDELQEIYPERFVCRPCMRLIAGQEIRLVEAMNDGGNH